MASHLVRGLNQTARAQINLTVLRPPTFARLQQVLADAKSQGQPFHLVHFDGHGTYADAEHLKANLSKPDAQRFRTQRSGTQGFLLFENPEAEGNTDYVNGPDLAEALVQNQVPILILNACRSAHADTTLEYRPRSVRPEDPPSAEGQTYRPRSLLQGQFADQFAESGHARAFASLAQEVMDAGVAGVVAMRYNLWVVTATHFVFELYRNLARGLGLGAAVSQGRRQLHAHPERRIAYRTLPLQDWPVPVVFEAAPIRLLPPREEKPGDWRLDLGKGPDQQDNLPPPPDIGFIGRDETLLALDRAFDNHPIVLLHAYAGSGKTVTAVEFARWYRQTDGLRGGPLLFTSFESLRPLYQVLGDFGEAFAPLLEQNGIPWGAINELEQRRQIALRVMEQVPLLWIWDNVEPVTGFPEGTESAWSAEEQQALRAFLQAANLTQAKILLTSRRDEYDWLQDLPRRIAVPPMPMQERAAFAEALADKQGQRLALVDWRPLLRFTEGNPLTLLVVVRQALAEGLRDGAAIAAFVERLRSGEAGFADEAEQGRDRSLAASLEYGFGRAFDEQEQAILALLVLFQGFVDVRALQIMGVGEWALFTLRGAGSDRLIHLLDCAARLGLLDALGKGYYRIHPALPWFFRRLFQRHYPEGAGEGRSDAPDAKAATRAFCAAMGALGDYYHLQYNQGQRNVIAPLRAEETNLRHAWRLARLHGLWDSVIGPMQGLRTLYDPTGRRAEWAAMVATVTPELVGPNDGPLPGREGQWGLITEYRVRLALEARDWAAAEQLQQRSVKWQREQAAPLLERPVAGLSWAERNQLRSLAASLHELGEVQRSLELPACVQGYQESLELVERIGDGAGAATCAFNLGNTYKDIAALRDLAQAEAWYRRSLELRPKKDKRGQAISLGQLGEVAWKQAKVAHQAQQPGEVDTQVRAALDHYHQALALLPADSVNDLAVAHNQLGEIYRIVGQLEPALYHYQECIRISDEGGDHYIAAVTRYNVALALLQAKRHPDALAYARAALRGYQHYGERAQDKIDKTEALIAHIEQAAND